MRSMARRTSSSTDPPAAAEAARVPAEAPAAPRRPQRAALRDPMIVERILERHGARPGLRPILDAPCGTGRLRGVLERRGMRYVGVDASSAMLREAGGREQSRRSGLCVALIDRLPFKDDASSPACRTGS